MATEKLTPDKEREIIERVRYYRDCADSGNADRFDRMDKNFKFTCIPEKQWDDALRLDMEDRGKLCVTIPLIRSQVKQFVGHVVQNPRDIVIENQRGGLRMLADVQTALAQHAISDQHVMQEIVQWCDQGATTGAGYLGLFIDKESDPLNGNLSIMRVNEFEVLPDPTCRVYDISRPKHGARFIIWEPWEDVDYINAKWRDVLDEHDVPDYRDTDEQQGYISWLTGQAGSSLVRQFRDDEDSDITARLRAPVTHCWWVEYVPVVYYYDLRQEELDPYVLTDKDEIKRAREAAEQYPDQHVVKDAIAPVMNHTILLGADILLDHIVDEFNMLVTGQAFFPLTPYYAFFNNGYVAGIPDDLIGLQEFINWTRSQVVNIMKNQPNSGWIIGSDAGNKRQWLEEHGGDDGIVINRADFGGGKDAVERIQPAPVPPLEALVEFGKEEVPAVSNIHMEPPSEQPKHLSGRAELLRDQRRITGISSSLSNLEFSLAMFGRLLATAIRSTKVYSDAEIKEVIKEKGLLDPQLLQECRMAVATSMGITMPEPPEPPDPLMASQMQPNQVAMVKSQFERHLKTYDKLVAAIDEKARPMAIQALLDAMRNPRRGRYNCRVKLSEQALSVQARNLVETVEVNTLLIESGERGLGRKAIIEASNLPNKEEILAEGSMG